MHIHKYFRKNKRPGCLVHFLASILHSEIIILQFPSVNLLSSPKSSVQPFPSLLAELVNSQLHCQQILFSNFLSVLEDFSPLFAQSEIQTIICQLLHSHVCCEEASFLSLPDQYRQLRHILFSPQSLFSLRYYREMSGEKRTFLNLLLVISFSSCCYICTLKS